MENQTKLIAFYLPQFHRIPENDEFWGKGFTEWSNVSKAKPLYEEHYQPHLPADLGFYDLRVKETRYEQMRLAKQYGIDAFCYYYYWFDGKRLLNQPIDDMFEDKAYDMPYCVCWANPSWLRRWGSCDESMLIEQIYSPENDLAFIKSMVPYFRDPRYIKINGAPCLLVFKAQELPDAKKTTQIWRDHCASVGIPKIHVCAALTDGYDDYSTYGFDSGAQFPPLAPRAPKIGDQIDFFQVHHGRVIDYRDLSQDFLNREYAANNVYYGVCPSWDNTARRSDKSTFLVHSNPNNYQHWLARAIQNTKKHFPQEERFVFINAWNEWAEGCHLEPDRKYGHQFLEATWQAKCNPDKVPEMVAEEIKLSSAPMNFWGDLGKVLWKHVIFWTESVKCRLKRYAIVRLILWPIWKKMRECWDVLK